MTAVQLFTLTAIDALAETNQNEVNRERKQREWMTRMGSK
jgi:hypothetical protein